MCFCFFTEPQSKGKRNDGNKSLTGVDSDTHWERSGSKLKLKSNRRRGVGSHNLQENPNHRDYGSDYGNYGSFHGITKFSTINSNTFNNATFYQDLFEFDPSVHFTDIKTKSVLIHWTRIYGLCNRFLNDITTVNTTNNKNISNIKVNIDININIIICVDLNILHTISKYQNTCLNDSFICVIDEYSKKNSNFENVLCHLCKHKIPSIFVKNEMPIHYERQETDT